MVIAKVRYALFFFSGAFEREAKKHVAHGRRVAVDCQILTGSRRAKASARRLGSGSRRVEGDEGLEPGGSKRGGLVVSRHWACAASKTTKIGLARQPSRQPGSFAWKKATRRGARSNKCAGQRRRSELNLSSTHRKRKHHKLGLTSTIQQVQLHNTGWGAAPALCTRAGRLG